jgi:hypothetical protein
MLDPDPDYRLTLAPAGDVFAGATAQGQAADVQGAVALAGNSESPFRLFFLPHFPMGDRILFAPKSADATTIECYTIRRLVYVPELSGPYLADAIRILADDGRVRLLELFASALGCEVAAMGKIRPDFFIELKDRFGAIAETMSDYMSQDSPCSPVVRTGLSVVMSGNLGEFFPNRATIMKHGLISYAGSVVENAVDGQRYLLCAYSTRSFPDAVASKNFIDFIAQRLSFRV